MWRANFTTNNTTITPSISSASLLTTRIIGQTSTSIPKRASKLAAEGETQAADNLRQSHPQFFNNGNNRDQQTEQLITLLRQVILKLEELKLMKEREEREVI